ncbi:hypothetical protein Mth01_40790 [Sphaerimonospora thailandensis]|uniref:Uncharacterized protein n=1 Tax=Sphaerimonospora thailandensis TaxID=795644 RepID=A0A8J3RCJ5_9ACTN|nr:hypothetical protein Mth01_40790 [Sphaerimonospora thailandensis]
MLLVIVTGSRSGPAAACAGLATVTTGEATTMAAKQVSSFLLTVFGVRRIGDSSAAREPAGRPATGIRIGWRG